MDHSDFYKMACAPSEDSDQPTEPVQTDLTLWWTHM